jgi:hypothetical protein
MKRDMNLIRSILLECEESPEAIVSEEIRKKAQNDGVYGYHCYLIVASGLADGTQIKTRLGGGTFSLITKLTPAGHDFLDATRDQGVWEKVQEKLASTVKTATIDIIVDLAKAFARQQFGMAGV